MQNWCPSSSSRTAMAEGRRATRWLLHLSSIEALWARIKTPGTLALFLSLLPLRIPFSIAQTLTLAAGALRRFTPVWPVPGTVARSKRKASPSSTYGPEESKMDGGMRPHRTDTSAGPDELRRANAVDARLPFTVGCLPRNEGKQGSFPVVFPLPLLPRTQVRRCRASAAAGELAAGAPVASRWWRRRRSVRRVA